MLVSSQLMTHFSPVLIRYMLKYTHRVPGEISWREVELDVQVSLEEMMSREEELGCESWTFSLWVIPQQQCNGHCPCDSAQHGG